MSGPTATTSEHSPAPPIELENMTTLSSFVTSKCEAKEEIEWKDLMEWFVCAVIGLDSKASSRENSVDFDWDDVVIDGFGTARISVVTSNSGSSPPHSPQPFSDDICSLSLLFIDLIDQLSTSNCLSKRVESHFVSNLIPSILHRLIDNLTSTGTLVHSCDQSTIKELIIKVLNHYNKDNDVPKELTFVDSFKDIWAYGYSLVNYMENTGLTTHNVRLTGLEGEDPSPQITKFRQLAEPELALIRKQYDPDFETLGLFKL